MDATAPAVIRTSPEHRALDVPADAQMEVEFDEPLAEGLQAQARRLVLFNPDRPEVVTNIGGRKVEIQPKAPLEPETTYMLTVRPGVTDRRNNATREPVRVQFSTGGPLTLTLIKGTVTAGGKPARGANVYAWNRDREFGYTAVADSAGTFEVPSVALGSYVVTAWNEASGEPGFQFTLEPGDSTEAAIDRPGTGVALELKLVLADTSAARLARADPVARDGLRLVFTDPLAPDQPLDRARAELLELPAELVPRGTAPDSIPQDEIRGERLAVAEVRAEPAEPRALLLRLEGRLADSTAYAVRYPGLRNVAGLTTPDDTPYLPFRTRAVPDSAVGAPPPPPPPGAPAPIADTLAAPGVEDAGEAPGLEEPSPEEELREEEDAFQEEMEQQEPYEEEEPIQEEPFEEEPFEEPLDEGDEEP